MVLTKQNAPTPTTVVPHITPASGDAVYVVALLDAENNPISYLTQIVDQSNVTVGMGQRLQLALTLAWKFTDEESAQREATAFSSVSGNPHLTVIPHP
jgi:hypothetical protein